MNDPRLVDVAQVTPGYCFFCKSITGPFIDTKVVAPPLQRIYICVGTCGSQIADLCSSQEISVRDVEIASLQERIDALNAELEAERENKVVPLEDVNEVWRKRVEQVRAEAQAS